MAVFKEIFDYLESFFPKSDAEPWDQDGMDICINMFSEISKIVLALDVTSSVIDYAKEIGANLIITHHPVLFDKMNVINGSTAEGKKIIALIQNGISCISYHTRLDKHEGGVNDSLCNKLGLKKDHSLYNGLVNVCNIKETDFESFCIQVEKSLGIKVRAFNNNGKAKKIALCGGGGKSCIDGAYFDGADTYITGEVDHMALINSAEYGINLILASHYQTEALVLPYLKSVINSNFPEISVHIKELEGLSK